MVVANADLAARPELASITPKLDAIRVELKTENVESDQLVDTAIACVLARGHFFIFGGPGTGKSQVVRGVFARLPGRKFIQQAKAGMDDQAFFGPISLKGLDDDRYEHAIAGHLADSEFAYVDEFMDANDMVLRSMLMSMNERQFPNGRLLLDIPLMSMFATTNFWTPEPEVEAVLDRFMARAVKPEIQAQESFLQVLRGHRGRLANARQEPGPVTQLGMDELLTLQTAALNVEVTPAQEQQIAEMWATCKAEGVTGASVRRFNIGLELCMARAIMRGDRALNNEDLLAYTDVLPSTPEEKAIVDEIVADSAGGLAKEARELRKAFQPHAEDIANLQKQIATDGVTTERSAKLIEIAGDVATVATQVDEKIREGQAKGADTNDLAALAAEIRAAQDYMSRQLIGVGLA